MRSFKQQMQAHQKRLLQAIETLAALEQVKPSPSPSQVIMTADKVRLIHFAPTCQATGVKFKAPLLICYALVNRPYILDLEPERSLIADLVAAGHSVYLIDWGYPDTTDQHLGLDDYIGDYLRSCVSACLEHSNSEQLDLLGVCQGGVFSLCYSLLFPQQIRKLITLVTPVDTSVEGFTLAQMISAVNIETLVKAQGNVSGSVLNQLYANLKPLELGLYKQLNQLDNLKSSAQARTFLRMEHWLADSPDLTGRSAVEFATGFFKHNGLAKGTLHICGQPMDLSQLSLPILNIFGSKDHLVPPASSKALKSLAKRSSEYQELELKAGHIGAFVSQTSRNTLVSSLNQFRSS
mgnify:FL=1